MELEGATDAANDQLARVLGRVQLRYRGGVQAGAVGARRRVPSDSDLLPAIKMVRAEFPAKEIVAVAPPMMGHSNDLIAVCQEKQKITPGQIWSCLLPEEVKRVDGTVAATRPKDYD